MRRALSTVLVGLLLTLTTVPTAIAVVPPFPEPSEWATICDATRPAGTNLVRGTNCRWITVDGHPRRYVVYVPRNRAFSLSRRWPLVYVFHGTSGDGERFWRISGWRALAEQHGFIVVFPTGLRYQVIGRGQATKWNSYGLDAMVDLNVRLDGYPATAPMPANDVKFVSKMTADIALRLRVAGKRMHLAGFSNGAQFAARLTIDRSRTFASAAFTGGGLQAVLDPARNTPVLFAVGTLDDRVLEVVNATADPDLTELPLPWAQVAPYLTGFISYHRDTYGMDPADEDVVEDAISTQVTWSLPLAGEDDGQEVRFLLMDEVIHQHPRATNNPNGFAFAAISWDWFENHRLP
jgi:polyhydroxybutyrate depolymerase